MCFTKRQENEGLRQERHFEMEAERRVTPEAFFELRNRIRVKKMEMHIRALYSMYFDSKWDAERNKGTSRENELEKMVVVKGLLLQEIAGYKEQCTVDLASATAKIEVIENEEEQEAKANWPEIATNV